MSHNKRTVPIIFNSIFFKVQLVSALEGVSCEGGGRSDGQIVKGLYNNKCIIYAMESWPDIKSVNTQRDGKYQQIEEYRLYTTEFKP